MHYDEEIFAQCVTEEELKTCYFTAFGARLPIEQMTKNNKKQKKVNGVLPFSGNSIVKLTCARAYS